VRIDQKSLHVADALIVNSFAAGIERLLDVRPQIFRQHNIHAIVGACGVGKDNTRTGQGWCGCLYGALVILSTRLNMKDHTNDVEYCLTSPRDSVKTSAKDRADKAPRAMVVDTRRILK
jgi:hypothetical protein